MSAPHDQHSEPVRAAVRASGGRTRITITPLRHKRLPFSGGFRVELGILAAGHRGRSLLRRYTASAERARALAARWCRVYGVDPEAIR